MRQAETWRALLFETGPTSGVRELRDRLDPDLATRTRPLRRLTDDGLGRASPDPRTGGGLATLTPPAARPGAITRRAQRRLAASGGPADPASARTVLSRRWRRRTTCWCGRRRPRCARSADDPVAREAAGRFCQSSTGGSPAASTPGSPTTRARLVATSAAGRWRTAACARSLDGSGRDQADVGGRRVAWRQARVADVARARGAAPCAAGTARVVARHRPHAWSRRSAMYERAGYSPDRALQRQLLRQALCPAMGNCSPSRRPPGWRALGLDLPSSAAAGRPSESPAGRRRRTATTPPPASPVGQGPT